MVLKLGPLSTLYVWMQVWPCWEVVAPDAYYCLSYEAPAPSSVYKPAWAYRKVSGRPACTYKAWRKRKTAIGTTWHHTDKWIKESLDGFTGTMLSYWMHEAALCNIRAPDTAWEGVCSHTWLFWASVSFSGRWAYYYRYYFLSLIVKIKYGNEHEEPRNCKGLQNLKEDQNVSLSFLSQPWRTGTMPSSV